MWLKSTFAYSMTYLILMAANCNSQPSISGGHHSLRMLTELAVVVVPCVLVTGWGPTGMCKTWFSPDSDTLISCQIESWFLDIAACIWVEGSALIDHMCFLMAPELQWQQEHVYTKPEVIVHDHPPTDPSKCMWYRFGCLDLGTCTKLHPCRCSQS